MRKKAVLLLIIVLLFGMIFETNNIPVNAEGNEEQKNTDQYDNNSLLARYSTAEIVAMYPEFSEYLASELKQLNTNISVSDFELYKENIGAVYFSVLSENPDIFYVFSTRVSTTANYSTGKILSIRPEYYFDIDEIPSKINEFNEMVNFFLSSVDRSWNDIVKARYLHDMLANYAEYDTKYEEIDDTDYELFKVQMRIYTAYGALVDNNAVCEGFAMAYNYLLSQIGIKSYYIQSIKNHHAWNLVQIGNNYYHVDIAHDDPTYDNLGRVNHNNFLKSDNYFRNDGDNEHTNWITNLKANDTSFDNAWWNDVNTVIYRYNGYDYYINQRYTNSVYFALTRRNAVTGEDNYINVLKTRWAVKEIENAFWDKAFSYICADAQYFYYNDTNSVYRVPKGGTNPEKIYTKPLSNTNCIYGIAFKSDGYLYITIKSSPYEKDNIYKIDIAAQNPTYTEAVSDTVPTYASEATAATEPAESSAATEPSSENHTNPWASEAITSPSTQPAVVEPTVIKKRMTLYLKQSTQITLTPKASYKFSSSNKKIAAVTSKGVITAVKAGNAVITAQNSQVIFKLTVVVKNPRLNYTKKTIKRNKSFTLRVVGGSGKITIKASNKRITINRKGKVTGKKKGKSTVTVRVCGLKLKCVVTVK